MTQVIAFEPAQFQSFSENKYYGALYFVNTRYNYTDNKHPSKNVKMQSRKQCLFHDVSKITNTNEVEVSCGDVYKMGCISNFTNRVITYE